MKPISGTAHLVVHKIRDTFSQLESSPPSIRLDPSLVFVSPADKAINLNTATVRR
jgi:hypothetical protein